MLTEKDQKRILEQGRSLELIYRQEEQLKKGIQPLNRLEIAVLEDGINALSDQEQKAALKAFQQQDGTQTWLKFVPASGAASRMFSDLFAYWDQKKNAHFNLESYLKNQQNKDFKRFITQLKKLPFYTHVYAYISQYSEVFEWDAHTFFEAFMEALLNEKHLDYSHLPKGLIPFFTDETGNAYTPFEAHLQEAIALAPPEQKIDLHFTIDKQHRPAFEALEEDFLSSQQTELKVSYSYQHPLTDTPVLDSQEEWVRNDEGHLLFRKGGHGALLENLNQIENDFVWLKNIDNIQWGVQNQQTTTWMQILGGITLTLQKQLFTHLRALEEQGANLDFEPVVAFIQTYFDKTFQLTPHNKLPHEKLIDYLHRPLRVCGMIKNEGKAGGGPFWMHSKRGRHLQIVEGVELNLETPEHQKLMAKSTHFNPVLMVCAITDRKGVKFPLHQFCDDQRYMIAHKTLGPKKIKALEWPGLWNGGMAHWNTYFVEVPKETFHPVKKVTDLINDSN